MSKPAGASSTFHSSFNLSSAALPTEPTSYGLEVLLSRLRHPPHEVLPTFAIVKGYNKFGAGISTGGANIFYADDVLQRLGGPAELETFEERELAQGSLPNLNLGTALKLYQFGQGPLLRLGLSARYNKITDSWGGGPALLLMWPRISLGAGITREKISQFLPPIHFNSYQAGVRFSLFEFEYNVLTNDLDAELQPIHIMTGTLSWRRWILTAAQRKLNYLAVGEVTQRHYAIQFLFSKHFSAGVLYNYIPGATSIGVQYFL